MKTNKPIERGYPLLADISGFVPFVTESETEHANEIIRELLEFIISRLAPIFTLGQVDGDAIFAYAPQNRIIRDETLFELLENTYIEFKDQLLQVSHNRSCGCNACRNASKLDLKFAIHFGEYIPNEFQKQFDLIGLAPYFIRKREWKQAVKQATDWRGYAIFTQECLTELGIHPDSLQAIEIPGGSVRTFGLNLESRYESTLQFRRVLVTKEEALHSFSLEFPTSVINLWNWINDPDKRTQWYILKWSAHTRPNGRTGSGAVNHCNHGIAGNSLETILDWRPFDYYTSEYHIRPFNIRMQQTSMFEALAGNKTKLLLNIKPADNDAGWFTKSMCSVFGRYERFALKRLMKLVNIN